MTQKILVVDDELQIVRVVRGYYVLTATKRATLCGPGEVIYKIVPKSAEEILQKPTQLPETSPDSILHLC